MPFAPTLATPAGSLPEVPNQRVNIVGAIGFFVLAALCTTNINFITNALFGSEQVFSLLYLASLLTILFAHGMRLGLPLGSHGRLWMFSIALFLLVSTRFGFGVDRAFFFSLQSNIYRIIIAQVITIGVALACRNLFLAGKMQATLRYLFAFMVLASLTIVLTYKYPGIYVHLNKGTQGRAAGFFLDPNRAGQAVCMSAAFGFATLVNENIKWKPFVYAGLGALIPCLFLTYSRSAIVFMACLVMLQFFVSPIMKQKGTLIGILILAVGIPFGVSKVLSTRGSYVDSQAAADLEQQKSRMQSLWNILSGNFDDDDTGHRWKVASYGLKYFASNPIIGAGYRKLVRMPEIGLGCHNTFLRIFGEAGIFVGLIYVAGVLSIALAGWRCKTPEVRCLVVGYIAVYCCASMVSHSVLTYRLANVALGVCLGFLSGSQALSRQQKRLRQQQQQQQLAQQVLDATRVSPQPAVAKVASREAIGAASASAT